MNVVCSIDNGYAQHCGVMLCSLFDNNPGVHFTVFLITDSLSEISRQKLDRVATDYNQQLKYLTIDAGLIQGARVSDYISVATYFRILIPRLLPDDIDKALYLDSDIIVTRPVDEFYWQPIDAYTHAAVANEWQANNAARLGIPLASTYFNAGVLLLNLRRWREEEWTEKILEYVRANTDKLQHWDQDALNATLYGRWLQCSLIWNAQAEFFENYSAVQLGIKQEDLLDVRSRPRIVHFSGHRKPWSYYSRHPFQSDYYRYLARTPWKGYRPFDRPSAPIRVMHWARRAAPPFVKQAYHTLRGAFRNAGGQA